MHVVSVWMVHRKIELILWPFNIVSTCIIN